MLKNKLLLLSLAALLGIIPTTAALHPDNREPETEISRPLSQTPADLSWTDAYLTGPEAVRHYAYLELDEVDPALRPVVRYARHQIIYQHGWIADDCADGYLSNPDGTRVETLPHFHELFPESWEIPGAYDVWNGFAE